MKKSNSGNKYEFSLKPKYQAGWDSAEDYEKNGIRGYEPMTAKELDTEEKQEEAFNDPNNYIENKFDGTRALIYFFEHGSRVFSRRISKKTGFYVENTDSLPQIRDIDVPELNGTIIDCEILSPLGSFEDGASILNCKYDKAIERQKESGFLVAHAFDILKYHGIDVRRCKLSDRKEMLHYAVNEAGSKYIQEVQFFHCGEHYIKVLCNHDWLTDNKDTISEHFKEFKRCVDNYISSVGRKYDYMVPLTPKAYYEYVVLNGGEGVMIKPSDGRYYHKRGWEYSKIKSFFTRELIIMGYEPPERLYNGKFPTFDKWDYWEEKNCTENESFDLSTTSMEQRKEMNSNVLYRSIYEPVTKYYAKKQVGNIVLGVNISQKEYEGLNPKKRGDIIDASDLGVESDGYIMKVCSCSGYNEAERQYITDHRQKLLGKVVEVKANGIFKDTGKMRHPRFLRFREDKNPEQCTWGDHVGSGYVP